jgi:Zn-dependent protease with chaperone function
MHGHTWALSLMSYYSTPAELFLRLILRMAASSCGCLIGWPILILALTTVGVLFYTFPPFALALVAWPIAIAAGRAGEFQADDYARRLGYGPELLIMLRELQDAGEDNDRLEFGLLSRVYSSHPPIYKRIQRIETSGHKPTAFG